MATPYEGPEMTINSLQLKFRQISSLKNFQVFTSEYQLSAEIGTVN